MSVGDELFREGSWQTDLQFCPLNTPFQYPLSSADCPYDFRSLLLRAGSFRGVEQEEESKWPWGSCMVLPPGTPDPFPALSLQCWKTLDGSDFASPPVKQR